MQWNQEEWGYWQEVGPIRLIIRRSEGEWLGLLAQTDVEEQSAIKHRRLSYVQMILKDHARAQFQAWVNETNNLDESGNNTDPYWYKWHLSGGHAGKGGRWDEGTLMACVEMLYIKPDLYQEDKCPLATSLNRRKADLERGAASIGVEWKTLIAGVSEDTYSHVTDFMNGV